MFVILPFEKEFYQKHQVHVDYVGNPVVDAVRAFSPANDFYKKYAINPAVPLVAFLPGSRHQEVSRHLTFVAGLAKALPEMHFAISVVNNLPENLYGTAGNLPNITLVPEDNYNLLVNAQSAVVASGTATLETALFNVPQVVIYNTSAFTYRIAKFLVKVKFISLVNLIANKAVIKELIQGTS